MNNILKIIFLTFVFWFIALTTIAQEQDTIVVKKETPASLSKHSPKKPNTANLLQHMNILMAVRWEILRMTMP